MRAPLQQEGVLPIRVSPMPGTQKVLNECLMNQSTEALAGWEKGGQEDGG